MATVNYEAAHKTLPPAATLPPASEALYYSSRYFRVDLRKGSLHGWLVRLLPYLEQTPLYRQFDMTKHIAANTASPQATQPAALLCPSDGSAGRKFQYQNSELGLSATFGKANIAGFANPYHVDGYDFPGAISLYGTPLRRVTDGLSRTLVLSEVRTRDDPLDQRGAWALPWAGASLLSFDMHPAQSRREAEIDVPVYRYVAYSLGKTQPPNSKQADVLYACPDPVGEQVDALPCTTDLDRWGYISAAPRSNHPGGVNAACLDGSGHFLSDDVDEVAMAYMISIDDETGEEDSIAGR